MLVETFEVPEIDCTGEVECEAEAVALIEQLGLEGQRQLLRNNDAGDTERNPYRKMSKYEAFVYRHCCPKITALNKYADGPIPLRVLQVAAHAKDLFKGIAVWSTVDADLKDPLLVGWNGTYETSPLEVYLLARWGDELEPFSKLSEVASRKFREKCKASASKILSRCQSYLARIDSMDGEVLADESEPVAYHLD